MNIFKKAKIAFIFLACMQNGQVSSAPFTVDLGQSLEIAFSFDSPFTGTPGVIRTGVNLTNTGYDHYFSNVSLYDGSRLLSGPEGWLAQFPYAGGAVHASTSDFSSIINRSIDGRFVISPQALTMSDGSSVATSFSFDPAIKPIMVDVTNAEGTSIVGRGTINSFSVTGQAYKPLQDFSSEITLEKLIFGGFPVCCGPFGMPSPTDKSFELDLDFSGGVFKLSFDIGLYGDLPSPELMSIWENGIEEAWSYKYELRDSYNAYPIVFDVNFEPGIQLTRIQSWVVEVHSETPDPTTEETWWSTENWYWTLPLPDGADPACWGGDDPLGRAAAHEFGHFLGLYDEYSGGKNGPFGVRTDGLMGSCIGKSVQDRYFEAILDSINNLTERDYVLGSLPGFIPSDNLIPSGPGFKDSLSLHIPEQIPEPPTLLLIAVGLILLVWTNTKYKTRNISFR